MKISDILFIVLPLFSILLAGIFFTALSLFIYALVTKNKPSRAQVLLTFMAILLSYGVYSLIVNPLEQLTIIVAPILLAAGTVTAFIVRSGRTVRES
jgi:uncharacterized membrane protein YwzB